ncbi:hypothetical protein HMSSN036_64630 [Paenibacillus macerans]|nr:hypothetical protein HMSSN036_64630 [Paenibacillus macerans]
MSKDGIAAAGEKRYKLLDEVDAALLAMADELLETEQAKSSCCKKSAKSAAC